MKENEKTIPGDQVNESQVGNNEKNENNKQLEEIDFDIRMNCVESFKEPKWPNGNNIPKKYLINSLIAMAIKWRRSTSHTVGIDVVQAINVSTETPEAKSSKYLWKNIIEKYSENVATHYICIICGHHLGSIAKKLSKCKNCGYEVDYKLNEASFLYLPLKDQLQAIFSETDAHECCSKKPEKNCKYAIEDIYDGKMYKERLGNNQNTITINFSIDGTPIFKSSKKSIYPVLCTINELKPSERRDRIILVRVWYGEEKPKDMNAYLKPFVTEAKKLYHEGFTYEYNGHRHTKRVIVLMGVCDAVARPVVRCSTQFNGKYGCGLCLHPGKRVKKNKGYTRIYNLVAGNAFGDGLRTHEETLEHAIKKDKEDRKGIKRKSILCRLPCFNIINSLDVDWMHCVGLGVVRQFVNLWFDSVNCKEIFYFGQLIDSIDSVLLSFSPTSEFSRTPRPLKDPVHLKAHEWIAFLLAYSLPLLTIYFPKIYVRHWALLVDRLAILIKELIMKSELIYAHQCLLQFIAGVETLYGEKHMSFNVHQLAHLTTSVENWGPLWTHSAFTYEDYNQTLKNGVKSPKGVAVQICDSFRLKCVIDKLLIACTNDLNSQQKMWLADILNLKVRATSTLEIGGSGVLGKPRILTDLPVHQRLVLQSSGVNLELNSTFFMYKRCILNREVITSTAYGREQKRSNYNVILKNGEIFDIQNFVGIKKNSIENSYAIGKYYKLGKNSLVKNRRLDHLIVLEEKIEALEAVSTGCIKKKAMVFKMPNSKSYVAYVHICESEVLT